ncbi:MAG: ATP-binding protein involved in chromosome partitioning [Alphaproteobacteria bacterium]|jgi:ATP-binding protein involved in chromosome partitioning
MTANNEPITEASVRAALKAVIDPDHGKDIVTLGRVTGLVVKGGNVGFAIEVDAARGPESEPLRKMAEDTVMALPGVTSVTVVLTAERTGDTTPQPGPQPGPQPNTGPGADIQAARRAAQAPHGAHAAEQPKPLVPGVTHIIAVASGKGGVGKSTVAANLALALVAEGHKVGVLDADIYGPSVPRMLGITGRPQSKDGKILEPMENYGLKAMSIGFLIKEDTPMIWRGPMVIGALEQMMRDVNWGTLDVLVVDMPPGTGDAQLTLAQRVPLAGAVIVSTPQDIALLDARKGIGMFQKVNVPVLGIIENMSTFVCPNCSHETHIFSHGGAKACAEELKVPFLGEIPLAIEIRETSDGGHPITVSAPQSAHAERFRAIARTVWDSVEASKSARGGPKIVIE